MLDRLLRPGVALQDEAEDRHEHEQQREQGEERVVGDEGREASSLIVGELPEHGDRDREPGAPLLGSIKRSDRTQQIHI